MRPDFKKVLTERPRSNSSACFGEIRARHKSDQAFDEDARGHTEGMRRPYSTYHNRKEFSDLIGPLHRFLQSSVGRPWDDVYSDVCVHLKGRNTIQQHLLQHLFQYVERNLYLGKNGKLYDDRDRVFNTGTTYYRRDFYVDPRDGILRVTSPRVRTPYRHYLRPGEKEPDLEYKAPDGCLFRFTNGLWFEITVTQVKDSRRDWATGEITYFTKTVTKKTSLNSRDLKRYGLRNS